MRYAIPVIVLLLFSCKPDPINITYGVTCDECIVQYLVHGELRTDTILYNLPPIPDITVNEGDSLFIRACLISDEESGAIFVTIGGDVKESMNIGLYPECASLSSVAHRLED